MDTELLRTFLEVNRTRHFGRAAANLYLTQSAVSSRIRMLEQLMGVALFTRERNDIQPTPEGRRLIKHAETILTAWNRARQEIAVEDEGKSTLTLATVAGVGPILLESWILAVRNELPNLVLNAEVIESATMPRRLEERTLDVALAFDPLQSSSIKVSEVTASRFVMVSRDAGITSVRAVEQGYVLVNWGTWFTVLHAKHFPEFPPPSLRLDLGGLAHRFILRHGGSAYLAADMVEDDLKAKRLFVVEDAPVLERMIYANYPSDSENRPTIERTLEVLRKSQERSVPPHR